MRDESFQAEPFRKRSGERDSAWGLDLEVRLQDGRVLRSRLDSRSTLLAELQSALTVGPLDQVAERWIQLPIDDAGSRVSVPFSQIASLRTSQPVQVTSIDPATRGQVRGQLRTAERLSYPSVYFSSAKSVKDLPNYEEAAEDALAFTQPFEAHRESRRAALMKICQAMGQKRFTISAFNRGYEPMFRNWAASCDRHGIDARSFTLLFPMDEAADRMARDLGFETFFDGVSYGPQLGEAHDGFGTDSFARSLFVKLAMTEDMLQLGFDVLRQDMDLIWFHDPLAELARRAEAEDLDLLFMRDINPLFQPTFYNSGFIYIRNNELSRFTWRTIFEAWPYIRRIRSEQVIVNTVVSCFRERGLRTTRLDDRWVDGEILMRADQGKAPLPADPMVAHVNWTFKIDGKIERLRRMGFWWVDDKQGSES